MERDCNVLWHEESGTWGIVRYHPFGFATWLRWGAKTPHAAASLTA